jgi:hypothetical protein
MGWIKDHTGSYAGGLLLLAALGIIAMGIVLMLGRGPSARTRSGRVDGVMVSLRTRVPVARLNWASSAT